MKRVKLTVSNTSLKAKASTRQSPVTVKEEEDHEAGSLPREPEPAHLKSSGHAKCNIIVDLVDDKSVEDEPTSGVGGSGDRKNDVPEEAEEEAEAQLVSYEEDGVMTTYLLDIVEVAVSHMGENLAQAFVEVIEFFNVTEKLLAVACDNASNNDMMLDELDDQWETFSQEEARVHCFCHILDLIAKSVICQFDVEPSKKKKTHVAVEQASKENQENELTEL
ncbi:hypothetical protein NP233_g12561 [Leucocoprinus birnbaumii]|uniref:Uncharacterized protein n=1 Tax=Leucocoprinus birnbaumii TaxID=56174 RepID=A0AAD5VID3_9AGAR|nr:hypothetical protein NP233_g12561 [Leucocoprinus birnbaumii]